MVPATAEADSSLGGGGGSGLGGGERGELQCSGHRVSVYDDEKVLETDSGDSCTTG